MAIPQEVLDILQRIDTATTAVAQVLTALRDSLRAGMSDAEVQQVRSTLTDVAKRLEGIAADPVNPVPTP
jgi:hypothetical protein